MAENRLELEKKEKKLVSELESQSVELEQKAGKIVKTSLIIGVSVLAGYAIYSLISKDSKPFKKSKKKKYRSRLLNSPIVKNLIQSALKKGIEMIVTEKVQKRKN